MRKLWIVFTLLLFLSRIHATGNSSLPPVSTVTVDYVEPDCREYQMLYSGGQITDSSKVVYLGYAAVIDRMVPAVTKLMDAAARDGINLKALSGYRTFGQQLLIRSKNSRSKRARLSLDHLLHADSDDFFPETGKPGHSKHQNGIAYDFNTRRKGVYRWMVKNAFKYGFVRTVSSEKWHWEYKPATVDPHFYVCGDHPSWIF